MTCKCDFCSGLSPLREKTLEYLKDQPELYEFVKEISNKWLDLSEENDWLKYEIERYKNIKHE